MSAPYEGKKLRSLMASLQTWVVRESVAAMGWRDNTACKVFVSICMYECFNLWKSASVFACVHVCV